MHCNRIINNHIYSVNRPTEFSARRRRRPLPKTRISSQHTTTTTILFLLLSLVLLILSVPVLVSAHVVLVHPKPRTDNNYLFTFDDGVCNPNTTCADFCGDPYDTSVNPTTVLRAGVPVTLQWKTNVVHEPFRYRLSLNNADGIFDLSDNILATVDHSEASDPTNVGMTGSFSTTVTIPESALEACGRNEGSSQQQPCVLQLWDLYYFVSCANVWLTTEELEDEPSRQSLSPTPPPSAPPLIPETTKNSILFRGASFDDYWVSKDFVAVEEEGQAQPELDPVLYLERCKEYTFVIDAPGHPLVLKTDFPGVGPENVLIIDEGVENEYYSLSPNFPNKRGIEKGTFVFSAKESAPSRGLFYQCTLHESMFSEIVLIDGTSSCGNTSSSAVDDSGGDKSFDGMEAITSAGARSTGGFALLVVLAAIIAFAIAQIQYQ